MTLLLTAVGVIVAGGLVLGSGRRARGGYLALVLAGCFAGAVGAVRVLFDGSVAVVSLRSSIPGGDLQFGADALSGVFLLTIFAVGAACAWTGARDETPGARGTLARGAFAFLVASIALVVLARSVVTFLSAWEVMAIASYVLIVTHYEDRDVRRAGLLYLVATHTATLGLYAMFATWASPASDWTFAALTAAAPQLTPGATAVILVLALVGFGFKAGAVPFHIWLPPAHAAAPSHVSALMSGIVIKTGVYGLMRVLVMLGGAPAWWSWIAFAAGVTSAILGVLWALAQHDIKRLLAYHSVENIGIIFMGLGVGGLGLAADLPSVAALGFAGALLHTVNHALFKSLLFLAAGVVVHATGTRLMDHLGGLARRMRWTWLAFATGAAAIVGLPPLNGFVSEWLVYQGMFSAADAARGLRIALVGIPALALVGALALACFAKAAGVMFLGQGRTAHVERATEHGADLVPLAALASACVAIGVAPRVALSVVGPAVRQLGGRPDIVIPMTVLDATAWISALAALAVGGTALAWWLRGLALRGRRVAREVTWACGYESVSPRMQYSSSSFAAPLLDMFGPLASVSADRAPRAFRTHAADLVLDRMALPAWNSIHRLAMRLRPAQQGRLHVYLLYVMAALLGLLGYLVIAGGVP